MDDDERFDEMNYEPLSKPWSVRQLLFTAGLAWFVAVVAWGGIYFSLR